ncbi:jg5001, partial [Pararge aegeria aegeria]
AFKLFKRNKSRKSARNRVSPALVRSPSYSGTVDAAPEIDLQRFCPCRTSMPPIRVNEAFENNESYYSYDSCSRNGSLQSHHSQSSRWDSAYGSHRSSPQRALCYAAVTYCTALDSEDSSSIHTEYTLLDADHAEDEHSQNVLNETRETVIEAALAEQASSNAAVTH